jgi:hypothetical protein
MFAWPTLSTAISPTPPPATGCTPGQAGIPDSPLGGLVCGTYITDSPAAVWDFSRVHWLLLLAMLAALIAVRVGWSAGRIRVWRRHADQGRWLQIIPPVTATPAATVGLWRLLATLLPAPRRLALRPARLVWEVHADPGGMRCGLWVPPGINPTAVVRVLQRGWPGARAEQARPPTLAPGRLAVARELVPVRPEWQPIVDDAAARASWRPGTPAAEEDDRLRAVYDGLAAAGRTGGGLLQVHVCRAPRRRVAVLRRATVNPQRAHRTVGASRVTGLLADGLRAVLIGILDFLTPGPPARSGKGGTDPYAAELARQARAKYASAPHLLVAVRATATGPTRAAARAAAADITSGFGLLSAHFTRRRVRRPVTAARYRWVPLSRMILASIVETAALAGLPAEPAAYGLPAAASRRRPASRDVFAAGPVPPGTTRAPKRRAAPPDSDAAEGDDPATVWSAP